VTYQYQAKQLLTISCCIDDLSPELYPQVIEKLFSAGAADAWMVPIIMKKGRPGVKLEVLLAESVKQDVLKILFTETTCLGVRISDVELVELERRELSVDVLGFLVRIKVAYLPNGEVANYKPEFEDCKKLSLEKGITLKSAYLRVYENLSAIIS